MTNSNLRLEDVPSRGVNGAPGWGVLRRASLLAVLSVLVVLAVLVALAGAAAFVLDHGTPRQPSFVDRALGARDGTFRPVRRWDDLTSLRIIRSGIRIAHAGHTVSLAAAGTGSADWTRHTSGVSRPTPFGSEAIVAAAPRAEELLTVDRHLGTRTWRWRLDAGDARPVVESDGSITLANGSVHILPVAVYDRDGRSVTPAGSRFGVSRSGGATWLTLRLDDAALPTPYTIDPIAIVGTPVTGNTKTGSPLPQSGNLALPAVANGNLLVASFTLRDSSSTVTIDSGITDPHPWTVLTTIKPSSNSQQQIVYWKVWQTGDPTSTKWTWSGGSGATDSAVGVIAYSGIYTGASPIETFTTSSGLAATTASTAAGSNTFANSMILLTYGISSRDTVATPTGTTSEWSITSTSSGPTVRATSQGFQVAQAAAGAIPSYSGALATDDFTAAMLSIRPAVGTPTAPQSTLSASPASVTADGSSTSTITATLKDAAGNPVNGKTVTLTAGSGSSTITTVSGTTNTSGQATFTVKDAVAQSVTYTAKDPTDNVTVTQTATVAFNPGTPAAAQSTVSASPTSVTADGATTSTVTVTLKDAGSNVVPGKVVTLTAGSGSSTIATVSGTTNASGQATFTVKDGVAEGVTYTAKDTTDNVTVTQTATVTFAAGPVTAAQSTATASPPAVVADGSSTSAITVTLKDAGSNPVAGKTVTLAAGSGSSTVTTVSGTTNTSGQATFTVKDASVESVTYTAKDTTDNVTVTQTATVAFTAGAVDAAASTVAAAPTSVVADGSTTSTVTVTARDAFGHLLAGKTVTLAQGGGSSTIAAVTGTTGASGQATFTVKDTKAETVTYTATVGATTILQSAQVVFTPGAATHLGVTAPASSAAGAAFSVTVTALDANGNTAAAYAGTLHFTASDAQAALPADYTFVPGTDHGVHTFGVTLKSAGAQTVGAAGGAVTGSAPVNVSAAAASASHSTVSASPGSVTADGSTTSTVTVAVADAYDNFLAGKTVTLAGSPTTSTITTVSGTTNASGLATFTVASTLAGTVTYTATVGSTTTVSQTASVAFAPGPANAGSSSIGAAPASLAAGATTTITVRAADAFGNALTGGGATVLLASDDGTLTPVVDNGDGTYTATLGWTGVGTAHVTGTLNGAAIGTPAAVTFGPGPANAAQSAIDAAPTAITADGSSTSAITVRADDLYGNALTAGGANVALSTDRGAIGAVTDNHDGTYTATLTAGTVAGAAHVTGTLNGSAIGHSAAVSFVPGAANAAHSAISASPTSIAADGNSTSTITVQAEDANDNHVKTGGAAFVLATDRGSLGTVVDNGDGTYSATLTSSTSAGAAHVTGTLGGVAIGNPATVDFAPGSPSGAHSFISASPATLVADGTATAAITVRLEDANGNDLTGGGAAVALATDAGSLAAVADNGDGTYSATLTAPATTGTAHVTGTVDGHAIAASAAVTLVPGAASASHSTVVASSGTASTDGGTVNVTVTALDAHDNPIAGAVVLLAQGATTASISPVFGTTTDAAGNAVFTVGDTAAEAAVFSATVAGTLVNQTAAVLFLPGAAARLEYGRQPANATAGATLAPSLNVRVVDEHGNVTSSSAAVTLSIEPGTGGAGASVAGTTTRNAVAGVATFDDLSIARAGSGYVLGATAAGVAGADSATFDVAPGSADAAHSDLTASPGAINADGTSGDSTLTVHVRDAFDNPVASGGATVSLASTRGALSSVADNGDGTYAATLTATGQSGTATVTGMVDGSPIGHPTSVTLIPPVPLAAIDSGAASPATSATSATFHFHSPNDDGNTTFECSLDGGTFAACTSPKSYSGLGDGSHTFRVHGVNANGAGSDVSQSWIVDTVGPTATLTTAPAGYTSNASEPLAATATDATTSVAAVEFRYAATAGACPTGATIATDTTSPYTASWSVPADGSYVVCAIAADVVGNAGAADSARLIVDRTKPTVSLSAFGTVVGGTSYVRGTPSLHAAASDATAGLAAVDFSFAGTVSGSIAHVTTPPYDASWNTGSLPDGTYTVTAAATDRAGNTDVSTRTVTVDATPPVASLDDPGAYGHGTMPLTATAVDTGSGVDAGATVIESSPHGAGAWAPIANPASWTPADGAYDLRATVKDALGNQTVTATRTILVDDTPPSVSDDGDASWHGSDVTLTLTAADGESGVATVEYEVDRASTWTTGTTVLLPTSLGDGTHTITYRATNRAGVTSPERTATVKLDATPPTVADPTVNPAAPFARGTVDLGAVVSDGAGSGIASTGYRLAPAGTLPGACATWGAAVASQFDTTTVPDGTYALRTDAVDNALNSSCSNVATATPLKIDNTPPTTSDDAPFGTQNADVTVHLTATDNFSGVAATAYRVDGGAWTTGTSVTVAAPASHSNDGTHTIEFRSTDVAGNVEATKTTQVTVDTTGPSGSGADPASLLRGTVQLSASPSESDIASVQWLYRPAGSSGAWTSIGADNAAPWQIPWLTTAVPDGGYDLEAVFTDTTGNSTTQAFSNKTVDNTVPDTAAVTAPVGGTDLSGTIALAATAHDATAGIDTARTTFEIQASGDSGWSDVAGNHFDTTTKPDGPAQVRVAVWDFAGNGPLYSPPVAFVIDNTAPTVALTAPTTASGATPLSASGSADVASVDFAYSPHAAGTWTAIATANAAPFSVSWATGSLADGVYDVRATAADQGGNHGSDVKTVRVDNTAPTAALTQPSAGATLGGSSVALAATASDAGSGVATLAFQYRTHGSAGAFTDIASTSSAPFAATWDVTGIASGDYDVRALVTDVAGNTSASAIRVVPVDSTPPSLTAFTLPAAVAGTRILHVTTSADTAAVTYAVSPSGGSGWTQVGASSTPPTFAAGFDTTTVADGTYDVRATAVDQYGNTASITVPNVRVDNRPPSLVGSTPADGSIVASLSSIDATASESLSAVSSLELDGVAAAFAPTISGASLTFPTGPLAEGSHALTGMLVDLAGNRHPFRINVTVASGSSGDAPPTAENVSDVAPTTLGTVDSSATVTVPAGVWQQPLPTADDWLVLRVDPIAPTAVVGTTSLPVPLSAVDVHLFWNLAGTEEHHFDAPIELDLTDPTGGFGIAATLENGSWRHLPALATPGALPAGQQDGYWRSSGVVHVLTRHLSVFAVLNTLDTLRLAPPNNFSGVVAADGLTLRWTPGMTQEQLKGYTLYVDGAGMRLLGPSEHEAKVGPITSADERRFTITETTLAGEESGPSVALRVVPAVAGLSVADATRALAARAFVVGSTIPTYAPQAPAGTVVGPTDVQVLAEGSAVDLHVAAPSAATSPFTFAAASAPRAHARLRTLVGRVVVTRRARVDVTLDARPWVRIQRWHLLHVKPGSSIVRLALRFPLAPGTYRMFWKATADGDGASRRLITPLTVLRPSARVHQARSPKVVVVGVQGALPSLPGHVDIVSPEQTYLYATYHDVAAIVVDADVQGLGLVRSLRTVFPDTALVALSRSPSRLAAAARTGAVPVAASTSKQKLAKLVLALAAR